MSSVIALYKRLLDLREERNKKQAEVAEAVGISKSAYSRYERGDSDVPTGIMIKLAQYYGVSLEYLVGLPNAKR